MIKKQEWKDFKYKEENRPIEKHIDWRTLKYQKNGITGEISIKENGRQIDRFIFNDKKGYKEIINVIKGKYGFIPETEKENFLDKEEIELLNKEREKKKEQLKENKDKGFLDKDWEW